MQENVSIRLSGIEQVVLVVGAASSRDHLISRLEAAPTRGFMVAGTFQISAYK